MKKSRTYRFNIQEKATTKKVKELDLKQLVDIIVKNNKNSNLN